MAVIEQTMTLEEFLRLPEAKPALEFRDGRVTQKAFAGLRHGRLQAKLAAKIDDYAESRHLGIALIETRCTFAGWSIVPDIIYIRWDRIPCDASGEIADQCCPAPDLSIEILGPTEDERQVREKLAFCVQNGVRCGLLVDEAKQDVTMFRPGRQPETVRSGRIDLSPPLAGFPCSVEEIFGWLVLPE